MVTISEKINVTANLIATMSSEPAERLGIAVALMEIYRSELAKLFAPVDVPTKKTEDQDNAPEAELPPVE